MKYGGFNRDFVLLRIQGWPANGRHLFEVRMTQLIGWFIFFVIFVTAYWRRNQNASIVSINLLSEKREDYFYTVKTEAGEYLNLSVRQMEQRHDRKEPESGRRTPHIRVLATHLPSEALEPQYPGSIWILRLRRTSPNGCTRLTRTVISMPHKISRHESWSVSEENQWLIKRKNFYLFYTCT